MSLSKRVRKLGPPAIGEGRRCDCRPRSWRVVTNINPMTGKERSEAEFEKLVPRCATCGGVGDGIKVRVVYDGEQPQVEATER
jgi:hypothetical protein